MSFIAVLLRALRAPSDPVTDCKAVAGFSFLRVSYA